MWLSDAVPNRCPQGSVTWSGPPALGSPALWTRPHRQLRPRSRRGEGGREEEPGWGPGRRGTRNHKRCHRQARGLRHPALSRGRNRRGQDRALHGRDTAWGSTGRESRPRQKSLPHSRGLVGSQGRPRGGRAFCARPLSFAVKPRSTPEGGRKEGKIICGSPRREAFGTLRDDLAAVVLHC